MDFYQTCNEKLGNIKGVGGGQREERWPRGKEARCNGERRSREGRRPKEGKEAGRRRPRMGGGQGDEVKGRGDVRRRV